MLAFEHMSLISQFSTLPLGYHAPSDNYYNAVEFIDAEYMWFSFNPRYAQVYFAIYFCFFYFTDAHLLS